MPDLADIRQLIPGAIFDPRYYSTNNVLGRVIKLDDSMQLEANAAQKLRLASEDFLSEGLIPVFWDLYRTADVQRQLLTFNSDPRYVKSPEDSNHVKGLAVDMTLAGADGVYLDMGTDFDDFSEKAHYDNQLINDRQRANRKLMSDVMQKYGFKQFPTEWWHFDFEDQNN